MSISWVLRFLAIKLFSILIKFCCDRRSHVSGQKTAQPKTELRLGSNSSSPPKKNGILRYILINIYIPPSNGNLFGSVTL
ncbi:MAG: hypothetical protein VKL42_18190 [Snowella sp.]|nr:hypothetical protein [Snowella sp.]